MYTASGTCIDACLIWFCNFTSYQNNTTPLYVASQGGHRDVVQTLLRAGADVNIATPDVSDVLLLHPLIVDCRNFHPFCETV